MNPRRLTYKVHKPGKLLGRFNASDSGFLNFSSQPIMMSLGPHFPKSWKAVWMKKRWRIILLDLHGWKDGCSFQYDSLYLNKLEATLVPSYYLGFRTFLYKDSLPIQHNSQNSSWYCHPRDSFPSHVLYTKLLGKTILFHQDCYVTFCHPIFIWLGNSVFR